MTTREKVLLSLCGVAAIGGAIYLPITLNSRAKKDATPAGPKDYTSLITKVQVGIKTGQLTARENGVLQAASTPWLRNPLRSTPLEAVKPEEEAKVVLPKYVGYINIADRPIAIIEGIDYRVGDMLDGGIFKLTSIFPDHVELLLTGANETLNIPLEKEPIPGQPK